MDIVIRFRHRRKEYEYTINSDMVDMTHYDKIWDFWVGENDNNIQYPEVKDEAKERLFEITAHKRFTDDGKELISGDGIYINVYANAYAEEYMEVIKEDKIEVLYQ